MREAYLFLEVICLYSLTKSNPTERKHESRGGNGGVRVEAGWNGVGRMLAAGCASGLRMGKR